MDELKDKRIFIIEDNATNMAVNAVTLRKTGAFIIQNFWNSDVIQDVLDHLPVDVILLDLMLRHDLSGYDVFERFKANAELAHIPVIIVSAADPMIEIPRSKEKGLAGFIGKPIVPRLFAKQIAACIEGEHIWYAQNGYMENEV